MHPQAEWLLLRGLTGGWGVQESALHIAATRGLGAAAALLVDQGAELDCEDLTGCTPLSLALLMAHRRCAQTLLLRGALADGPDQSGVPLQLAVSSGQLSCVQVRARHNQLID